MPLDAAISAAPGVDQAVTIGMPVADAQEALVAAMLRQSAATQEVVWAASAPDRLRGGDDDRDGAAEADEGRDEGGSDDRQAHEPVPERREPDVQRPAMPKNVFRDLRSGPRRRLFPSESRMT